MIGAVFLLETLLTKKKFVWVPHNAFVLMLFGAVLLSQVAHAYLQGLLDSFSGFLPNVVLYFLLLNTVQSARQLKIVVATITALNILLVFQGMNQLEHGYGWAGQPPVGFDKPQQPDRITWVGIFNDPNDLALSFVIAAALASGALTGRSGLLTRLLSACALGFLSYGIYLTNSRGGVLALLTVVVFLVGRKTKHLPLALSFGAVLLPLVLLLGPSRAAELAGADASAQGRLDAWYYGLQLLRSNPMFGAGYGMFTDDFSLTAHNSYVLAAAELGLFGLFCWVGLIYFSYKGSTTVFEGSGDLNGYALGVQSALIGFSVAAFFLSRTYTILPYLLFALSGSMLSVDERTRGVPARRIVGADLRNIIAVSLGVLMFAYVGLKVGL